jgi:hypothetical protein
MVHAKEEAMMVQAPSKEGNNLAATRRAAASITLQKSTYELSCGASKRLYAAAVDLVQDWARINQHHAACSNRQAS